MAIEFEQVIDPSAVHIGVGAPDEFEVRHALIPLVQEVFLDISDEDDFTIDAPVVEVEPPEIDNGFTLHLHLRVLTATGLVGTLTWDGWDALGRTFITPFTWTDRSAEEGGPYADVAFTWVSNYWFDAAWPQPYPLIDVGGGVIDPPPPRGPIAAYQYVIDAPVPEGYDHYLLGGPGGGAGFGGQRPEPGALAVIDLVNTYDGPTPAFWFADEHYSMLGLTGSAPGFGLRKAFLFYYDGTKWQQVSVS